jgi:hypothetical protein
VEDTAPDRHLRVDLFHQAGIGVHGHPAEAVVVFRTFAGRVDEAKGGSGGIPPRMTPLQKDNPGALPG